MERRDFVFDILDESGALVTQGATINWPVQAQYAGTIIERIHEKYHRHLANVNVLDVKLYKNAEEHRRNQPLSTATQFSDMPPNDPNNPLIVTAPIANLYIGIDDKGEAEAEALQQYRHVASEIMNLNPSKVREIEELVNGLDNYTPEMPFIVLENSSGTGKTQMAFNLMESGVSDVFYVLCSPVIK